MNTSTLEQEIINQDSPCDFPVQYYYREDIGIIKAIKPNQASRSIVLSNELFNTEYECMINVYKTIRNIAKLRIDSAREVLEQETKILNDIDEEFNYLKLEYPERFI